MRVRNSCGAIRRLPAGQWGPSADRLRGVPVMCEFLDVLDEAEQLPLPLPLPPPPQGDPVEPLVVAEVPEDRFDRRESFRVVGTSLRGIDPLLHPRRVSRRCRRLAAVEKRDLSYQRFRGRAYTLRALRTRHAVAFRPLILVRE